MRTALKRPTQQRALNLSITESAASTLDTYVKRSGCTRSTALALAVERYRHHITDNPPPTRAEGAGVRGGITGGVGCGVFLPLELQTLLDTWTVEYDCPVGILIGVAVERGLA